MATLDLILMGTPDFSVPCLSALIDHGHRVVAVYTQPPRPAGRGKKLRASPVHQFAEEQGIDVRTPVSLRDADEQAAFASLQADAAVVVAYGLILPQAVLDAPRLGCFNVHASLLPRWRGAAPIQRAIMAGDRESGVSIMQMEAGLDTGPVILSGALPLTADTTAGTLHDKLAQMGAFLMVRALDGIVSGELSAEPQPEDGVTYAEKLTAADEDLDWTKPAEVLDRQIRAMSPWPGCRFTHGQERIKVTEAELIAASGTPGTALDDRLTIACGDGALRLKRLQRPGKKEMAADDFLRGYTLPPGTVLG